MARRKSQPAGLTRKKRSVRKNQPAGSIPKEQPARFLTPPKHPMGFAEPGKKRPFKFLLRMPLILREQLEKSAKANGYSLNVEIVRRLEDSILPTDLVERIQQEADKNERTFHGEMVHRLKQSVEKITPTAIQRILDLVKEGIIDIEGK